MEERFGIRSSSPGCRAFVRTTRVLPALASRPACARALDTLRPIDRVRRCKPGLPRTPDVLSLVRSFVVRPSARVRSPSRLWHAALECRPHFAPLLCVLRSRVRRRPRACTVSLVLDVVALAHTRVRAHATRVPVYVVAHSVLASLVRQPRSVFVLGERNKGSLARVGPFCLRPLRARVLAAVASRAVRDPPRAAIATRYCIMPSLSACGRFALSPCRACVARVARSCALMSFARCPRLRCASAPRAVVMVCCLVSKVFGFGLEKVLPTLHGWACAAHARHPCCASNAALSLSTACPSRAPYRSFSATRPA